MKLINPFKPTAGMIPPVLIGRKTALDDFDIDDMCRDSGNWQSNNPNGYES